MATQVTVITGEGSTTYSVSTGARGPAGPAGTGGGGSTPAGSTLGQVQLRNSDGTALAADSGLVYTGTGDTGVLQTGRGQIAINALPYSSGTLASNIGIGFNPFIPTSNATISNNVQGNIGIGDNALDSLSSTGGYSTNNIAIGTGALASLANCQASVFIGTYAGINLTADSSGSTIVGDAAGVYYGAAYDSLTQAAQCTFLGRLTRGSAAASTNQIVIGNGAIGDQNNSTVIGNSSTTQTRLAGNALKLGSATLNTSIEQAATGASKTITLPNATGIVPVFDTLPLATGKVLTSSGVLGAATWADPTGGTAVTGTAPIVVTSGVVSLSTTLPDAYAFTNATRPTAVNTSAPASNSLMTYTDVLNLTLRDVRTYNVNYSLGAAQTASGGTSGASRGYWQLFTSTTASSKAQIYFDMAALVGNSSVINFDRRIIVNTRISPSTLRSGLQYYCQVGRTVSDGTAAQLSAKKGFGYGLSGSTITPFVNNGSGITNGTTFSVTTYPFITMDFVAGVALYVYGQTLTSTTPVLLSTISTGLPSGNSTTSDGQLEFLVYDTGSGGGNNWLYLGNASMTIL